MALNGVLWRYSDACDPMVGMFFLDRCGVTAHICSHTNLRIPLSLSSSPAFFFLESRADSGLILLLSSGYGVLPGLPHPACVRTFIFFSVLILSNTRSRAATARVCYIPRDGLCHLPPSMLYLSTAMCMWRCVDLEVRHTLFPYHILILTPFCMQSPSRRTVQEPACVVPAIDLLRSRFDVIRLNLCIDPPSSATTVAVLS